jgi:DNA-binding response OmpR family regulator
MNQKDEPAGEAATISLPQRSRLLTVLVADPNEALRARVRQALGDDYVVHEVPSGALALAALRDQVPDLLISEVDLPDFSGFVLSARIRQIPSLARLPIMLLTTRASLQDKVTGFQSGADDYLVKPFDPRLFSFRVRLLCRIKKLEDIPGIGLSHAPADISPEA